MRPLLFEWDWARADDEFRRALSLSRRSEGVNDAYALFLVTMLRLDGGLAEGREVARLYPLFGQPIHDTAINALARGNFEVGAAGFRRTIAIDANWTRAYIKRGRTLAIQKKCQEAIARAETAERRIADGAAPTSRSWLGASYGTCGDTVRARQKPNELHALAAKPCVDLTAFADILMSLGKTGAALECYARALADRSPSVANARLVPRLYPRLATSARYTAVIARMRLPPPAR